MSIEILHFIWIIIKINHYDFKISKNKNRFNVYLVPTNNKEFDKQIDDTGWVKWLRLGKDRTSNLFRYVSIKILYS